MHLLRARAGVLGWSLFLAGRIALAEHPALKQAPDAEASAAKACVVHTCRLVPEVKQIKKTIYEVQEVPYCLKKLPPWWSLWRRDCQETCSECECPRYRKVLVKKEIVVREICTNRCVVEEHRQPCNCPSCCLPDAR